MYWRIFAGFLGLLILQACGSGTGTTAPVPAAKQFVNWSTVERIAVDSSITAATQTAGGMVLFTDTFNGLSIVDDANLEQISVRTKVVDPTVSDGVGHVSYDMMNAVARAGNVALVAVTPGCIGWCIQAQNALRLYDIGDSTNVTYLATLDDSLHPNFLLPDGNYLYFTGTTSSFSNQFAVIDISDPKAPKKLGAVDLHGAGPLAKVGSRVFVSLVSYMFGWDWHNIKTIDVTNPSEPFLIGSPDQGVSANITFSPIVVTGNTAYVDYGGLRVVDVTDVLSPTLLDTITLPDSIFAMTSYGNYLYVACGTGGLRIFDISHPQSPVLVKTIATETSIRFVSVTDSKGIYITDGVVNTPISSKMHIFHVNQ